MSSISNIPDPKKDVTVHFIRVPDPEKNMADQNTSDPRQTLVDLLGISYEEADRCIATDSQDIRGFIAVPKERKENND